MNRTVSAVTAMPTRLVGIRSAEQRANWFNLLRMASDLACPDGYVRATGISDQHVV
jgi:hypothetical protein